MTLKEALEARGNSIVLIGSKSGWIYAGKASEFDSRGYSKLWEDEFRSGFKLTKKKLGIAKRSYERLKIQLAEATDAKDKDEIAKALAQRAKKIKTYTKSFKERKESLESFLPMSEREVVETYKRFGEGEAILITGDEEGVFWDKEEFDRGWIENESSGVPVKRDVSKYKVVKNNE